MPSRPILPAQTQSDPIDGRIDRRLSRTRIGPNSRSLNHPDSFHLRDDTPSPSRPHTPATITEETDETVQPPIENGDLEKAAQEPPPAKRGRHWEDNIVDFDGPEDPRNPKNWTFRHKTALTFLMGCTTMCSTFASSVISSGVTFIANDFGVSTEVATLTISLFVLGYVPGPIIFGPLSEMYGRRISILLPMIFFLAFSAGSATAKDLQTLMITRFFGGFFASAPVSNVAGGLSDMWNQKQRASAVVLYSFAVVGGPTLGPIIGAAVSQSHLGWRWTEYLTVIIIAVVLTLDIFFLRETFAPVILTHKAQRLRLETGAWGLHSRHEMQSFTLRSIVQKTITRPLVMLAREPIVLLVCAFNAFAYGILYLLFSAFPIEFQEIRGWNDLQGSLPFLGVLVGVLIAGAINITYSIKVFAPIVDKHGIARPEHRLPPMMLGAVLFPIGFFWFGWTSGKGVSWANDILAAVVIGTSFLLIFQSGINYLIDVFSTYSASAVAANTFLRSFFAAGFPLIAQPLFHNLGVNWACSLLGFISIALAIVPFLFYVYGAKLRSMSRFAKN